MRSVWGKASDPSIYLFSAARLCFEREEMTPEYVARFLRITHDR
ncbi:hypothetical protein VPMS16_2669 [Vibrio sp. 16]|nr:hypothetical protein VPMS16_2669 [Vibrio sp. 16]